MRRTFELKLIKKQGELELRLMKIEAEQAIQFRQGRMEKHFETMKQLMEVKS
ncbi:hypothetical protein ABR775_07070 [Bacillus cereus]|uniref:hypothetical protein n=1 Tax=Bacillus cereus TaxID=1396 RepID=UPI0035569D79|nr:hypothetical protein [Bacillus cereus]